MLVNSTSVMCETRDAEAGAAEEAWPLGICNICLLPERVMEGMCRPCCAIWLDAVETASREMPNGTVLERIFERATVLARATRCPRRRALLPIVAM
jgi:hypothetical protein